MHIVRVWDLPTRLFHWCLVVCFVGLVITGQIAGEVMVWHFRLGYAVLTLLLFRLVWGLVGGHWSRFATFIPSPRTLLAYLRGQSQPAHTVGHNPLGALSVLALLGFALLQVAAGLMSDDEIAVSGPLVSKVPGEWVSMATFIHTEVIKVVLIVLVALHVLAIVFYKVKKSENLVRPMILGDKEVSTLQQSSNDTITSRFFALGVLLLCAMAVWLLLRWAS
jgi:cytochrome b